MLGSNQRQTLFRLFDVITSACAENFAVDSITDLEHKVHRALALFERDFPVSLQVIVFHLLHHLPMYIKRFGPVYSFWMYHYERFNSWISRRVLNKRYPESTVVETYRLSEWANFMEVSGQLAEGATIYYDEQKNESLLHTKEDDTLYKCCDYDLVDEQLDQLRAYYLTSISDYEQLVKQYDRERKRARVSHHLREFPSFREWQPECLSDRQHNMQCGPSPKATRVKYFTYIDSNGRNIKLSTVESDREYLYRRCSYISACIDNVLTFGRILTIFHHNFLSTSTSYICIYIMGLRDQSGIGKQTLSTS